MAKTQIVDTEAVQDAETQLQEGMALAKCRKCQCMKDALDNVSVTLRSPMMGEFAALRSRAELWLKEMQPVEYQ